MILIDAHEDLAWNMLTFARDYTRSAADTRASEEGSLALRVNGNTLLGKDDWIQGQVAIIFATLFNSPDHRALGSWDTQSYRNPTEAHDRALAQMDAYHRLIDEDETFRLIATRTDLTDVLNSWEPQESPEEEPRVGLIPLMEGAEPILEPAEVEEWFDRGLRIVGLSWEATRYAGGTHEAGPVTSSGFELLEVMASLNMILDLSHLAEEAYYQALEAYSGVVIASHANPRRFLPTSRGLSDTMISLLAERDGVVGIVPFNRFLKPGWSKADPRSALTLQDVASAIDHICQVTGSARHVGIGTDFDGGFGVEQVPEGIDTIADLQSLVPLLSERGYSEDEVMDIMHGNWLRILQNGLPD